MIRMSNCLQRFEIVVGEFIGLCCVVLYSIPPVCVSLLIYPLET